MLLFFHSTNSIVTYNNMNEILRCVMENNYYPFVNQPLPYDFDALEPFIDEKTMFLHHNKHLQTYIDNLNAALENCPKLFPSGSQSDLSVKPLK